MTARLRWAALSLLLGTACDSGTGADADAKAKADAEAKAKADAESEARRARIKQEREAKAAAEQQAAEDKKAELQRLAVVPDDMPRPKKLTEACAEVAAAHDRFMQRLYDDDAETLAKWEDSKGTQMPFTVSTCTKSGSLDAALCEVHALDTASKALREDVTEIMRACLDKYRKDAPPPAE